MATYQTDTAARVLEAIRSFWEEHHYAPSFRDIQERGSISSQSVVDYNLVKLQRMGLIRFDREVTRSIVLVEHLPMWEEWYGGLLSVGERTLNRNGDGNDTGDDHSLTVVQQPG
jgi:SOS-response transcriptional repressor LexA